MVVRNVLANEQKIADGKKIRKKATSLLPRPQPPPLLESTWLKKHWKRIFSTAFPSSNYNIFRLHVVHFVVNRFNESRLMMIRRVAIRIMATWIHFAWKILTCRISWICIRWEITSSSVWPTCLLIATSPAARWGWRGSHPRLEHQAEYARNTRRTRKPLVGFIKARNARWTPASSPSWTTTAVCRRRSRNWRWHTKSVTTLDPR